MKANITLKLDSDLLHEARVLAAEENTSISAMLAEHLEKIIHERKTYHRARKRALARSAAAGHGFALDSSRIPRRTSWAMTRGKRTQVVQYD